jgi:putative tryptophan/tyrosine transport system substrate-binding protein
MRPLGDTQSLDDPKWARAGHRGLFFPRIQSDRTWVRAFIASAVALLLLAAPHSADALDSNKPIRIGVLALGPRYVPAWHCGQTGYQPGSEEPERDTKPYYVTGLFDQLKKLNYVEERPENAGKQGRHFVLTFRTGTLSELKDFAREFAAGQVDIIVAVASEAVEIAQQATQAHPIPILMTGVSDPVKYGFVRSLARPGGYITGVSHQVVQGSGKRVELFKEMLPGLKRLLTIRQPDYAPPEKSLEEIRDAADRLKIGIIDRKANSRQEIRDVMASVRPDTVDGIMILADSVAIANLDLEIETSLAQHVPLFGIFDYMAAWGAVAADGPSAYQAGTRVASYVDKISKGANPGDLAVEPVDPHFVINLKAAKCLGISVPLEVLSQADEVIR